MKEVLTSADIRVEAYETQDSRGKGTVEVLLTLGEIRVVGDVPAGASKGEDEAQTVSVAQALQHIQQVIVPGLQSLRAPLNAYSGLVALEQWMVQHAGENFKTWGANAVLPLSRALWRLYAAVAGKELFAYIQSVEPSLVSEQRVSFLMNIFNGGLHALKKADGEVLGKDRIDIQEIMVVPVSCKTYREALQMGEKIDAALKNLLVSRFGAAQVTRADEAGFSVKGLGNSDEAIGYVVESITMAGYVPGVDVKLSLDVAASSFYDASTHRYMYQGRAQTTQQMVDNWVAFVDRYAGMVLSIEDGLAENDWEGWCALTQALASKGVLTVGDDLFVTQKPRLQRGIDSQAANAILIKVNQNGTVYGTLEVMKMAKQAGMQCIVSHRSGETLDSSIADLAYATGSLGLKTGDPQPEVDFPQRSTWVRRVKYLRMLEIEQSQAAQ
jgi:enolase